jgi:hypothetical protein
MQQMTDTMTSRQRVLNAIDGKPVDRTPARFNGGGEEAEALAKHLGISLDGDGEWKDRLRARLRVDIGDLNAKAQRSPGQEFPTESGAPWEKAETLDQVDPRWAETTRNPGLRDFTHALPQIERWDASDNPPAVFVKTGALFGIVRRLRGDTQALMDLADGHEIMIYIMDRMEEYVIGIIDQARRDLGERVDAVHFGEELGMQTGLMYSPESIREHFFPRMQRIFERCHACGYRTFLHSCGAIEPLIDELIEMGVDVLNPIQPYVPGMDPEHLAERFGGRITFCGGIDMQRILPFGTPQEVREETERYIRTLAPRYILDYANILHPDVPPENSLAMYDTPR